MSTATTHAPRSALTAKGAATRARIVEAAATLVRQRGAAGASIDEVRSRAGVSASQMYHYFGDKRELVRAVVAHEAALVVAAQQPELDSIDSLASLRAWRDRVVETERAQGFRAGSPLGSLASELVDTDPDARPELLAGFERWESPLLTGLRTMRDNGELRFDADIERLSLALLGALQGGLLLSQLRRDGAPLEAALDAVLERIESLAPAATISTSNQPRRPLTPAIRRTATTLERGPVSPGGAIAGPAASRAADSVADGAPAGPTVPSTPASPTLRRTPLRPRRPLAR